MPQLMRTSNPALGQDTFRTNESTLGEGMTISGAVNKTGILVLLCVASAAFTWNRFFAAGSPEEAMAGMVPLVAIGGITLDRAPDVVAQRRHPPARRQFPVITDPGQTHPAGVQQHQSATTAARLAFGRTF